MSCPEFVMFGDVVLLLPDGAKRIQCVYTIIWKPFELRVSVSGVNEPQQRPNLQKNDSVRLMILDRETVALVTSAQQLYEPIVGHVWSLTFEINENDSPFDSCELKKLDWEPFHLMEE